MVGLSCVLKFPPISDKWYPDPEGQLITDLPDPVSNTGKNSQPTHRTFQNAKNSFLKK